MAGADLDSGMATVRTKFRIVVEVLLYLLLWQGINPRSKDKEMFRF